MTSSPPTPNYVSDEKRLELQSMPEHIMRLAKDQFGSHFILFEVWVGDVIDKAFDIGKASASSETKERLEVGPNGVLRVVRDQAAPSAKNAPCFDHHAVGCVVCKDEDWLCGAQHSRENLAARSSAKKSTYTTRLESCLVDAQDYIKDDGMNARIDKLLASSDGGGA